MDKYTIPCTEEQTRQALKLGAPIREVFYDVQSPEIAKQYNLLIIDSKLYCIPTAEQMIGWLEEQLQTQISISFDECRQWFFNLGYGNTVLHDTHKGVILAAIDDALEDLMTEKGE